MNSPLSYARGRAALAILALLPNASGQDLPLQKIKLPPGFEISVVRAGSRRTRAGAGRQGRLRGVAPRGQRYAVVPREDGKPEVVSSRSGLNAPTGVAYPAGSLYVAEVSRISRYDNIEANLRNPPKPVVVTDRFPRDDHHGWKYIAFGPDGWLYVPVGAPCNVCEPDPDRYALISRIKPDGSGYEVVARGVRNTVGFDWDPRTGELWFNDHGRDMMGDELPSCELQPCTESPECTSGIRTATRGHARSGVRVQAPLLRIHAARAEAGRARRARRVEVLYRQHVSRRIPNRIFIAQHGSWNRSKKSGYRVIMVSSRTTRWSVRTVFAEGWLENERDWGRPVDMLVMPDGAMLISDDQAGVMYRVSYRRWIAYPSRLLRGGAASEGCCVPPCTAARLPPP